MRNLMLYFGHFMLFRMLLNRVSISHLPETATNVNVSWILGNCFYLIDFEVADTLPYMNMDVPHKGSRGGPMMKDE